MPRPIPMPCAVPVPPAADGRRRTSAVTVGLLTGLTVLCLALTGVVASLFLRPVPVAPAPVVVAAPAASTTGTAADAATGSATWSGSTTSSGSTDTEQSSAALLDEGVARDRASVETLSGSWVAQLSAKKVGTVADGRTYDSTDILGHYGDLRTRISGALLLWSGDWPVFTADDYWVVVAPQSFSTPAAANAWCDAQGFDADDCMAKRLSHSGGPTGATVARS